MPVAGDPLLLAQAVSNLIDNALKYARDGGKCRSLKCCVGLTARSRSAWPMMVQESRDAEKTKVTERFYRGDTSRGTPGVGLGLSLVAAVAKLHGGVLVLGG